MMYNLNAHEAELSEPNDIFKYLNFFKRNSKVYVRQECAGERLMESSEARQTNCTYKAQEEKFRALGNDEVADVFAALSAELDTATANFSDAFDRWSSQKKE